MSIRAVMSRNRPSWMAEEPSKTGLSAVQCLVTPRQNGAFCLINTPQENHPMLSGLPPYYTAPAVSSNLH